jgi:ketosteroid isomerase-like protein
MDAEAAARAWVEGWSSAWPARDAGAVAALYAEGAVFRSHPFREPQPPVEYAA